MMPRFTQRLLTALAATVGVVFQAQAATLPIYINNGSVFNQNVDASAFLNNGTFDVFLPAPQLYDMQGTLFVTNSAGAVMSAFPGFQFDFVTNSTRSASSNFVNKGQIFATTRLLVTATNLTNASTGFLNVSPDGLIKLTGSNVNLTRSGLSAGGTLNSSYSGGFSGTPYVNHTAVRDLYWGLGTNNRANTTGGQSTPITLLTIPSTRSPAHDVFFKFNSFSNRVALPRLHFGDWDAVAFTNIVNPTNFFITVVFFPISSDPNLVTDVRFSGQNGTPVAVEFSVDDFDVSTGQPLRQALYVVDRSGSFGFNGANIDTNNAEMTFRSSAYQITYSPPPEWTSGTGGIPFDNDFTAAPIYRSNRVGVTYSAYGVSVFNSYNFNSSIAPPDDGLVSTDATNAPGRVVIDAVNLDLTRTRVRAETLLDVRTPNIVAITNSVFDAPFVNLNFISAKPTLVVDSVVTNSVVRINGEINIWSAFYTNSFVSVRSINGTNFFFTNTVQTSVAVLDHNLATKRAVEYGRIFIKGTNLVVSDPFQTQLSLLLDSAAVTVGPTGFISVPNDLGVSQLPALRYLTNQGGISAGNVIRIGSDTPQPVSNIVNSGFVFAPSVQFNTFALDNSGILDSFSGPLILSAGRGVLTNSQLFAAGDIEIHGRDLTITNVTISANAALVLDVTNNLTDGGVISPIEWLVGDGFRITKKPAVGGLLGTTLRSVAPQFAAISHVSTATDRGADPSGYTDNAALGRLILDGAPDSLFAFSGTGVSNALYVDFLQFDNDATNYLDSLEFDPNITVYFADSNLPAEKLDGLQGGRLRWVRSYAGNFSSVTVTNADLSTSVVNRALRFSSTIDSDADGIPNAFDAFPFDPVAISLTTAAAPSLAGGGSPTLALVSWEAAANTTYRVECQKTLGGAWEFLRNYTHGPVNSSATVSDQITTNGACFYRVIYYR